MIGKKISDQITKDSKFSPRNNTETFENETENTVFDRERPEERYISPLKRQQIINDLRLI